jgi:hypothetical protein
MEDYAKQKMTKLGSFKKKWPVEDMQKNMV